MPGVTVKIERKRSLSEQLRKQVPANAAAITKEVAEEAQKYIQDRWSPFSPSSPGNPPAVVTGMLDASIEVKPKSGGQKPAFELRVQAWYASYLEFGTKRMAARPFIRPAVAGVQKGYRTRFKNVFKVS